MQMAARWLPPGRPSWPACCTSDRATSLAQAYRATCCWLFRRSNPAREDNDMKPSLIPLAGVIAMILVVCGSALAHHGNVAYDEQHPTTINGVVTEFVWSNPHCQIYLDVKDKKGNVVNWGVESQ